MPASFSTILSEVPLCSQFEQVGAHSISGCAIDGNPFDHLWIQQPLITWKSFQSSRVNPAQILEHISSRKLRNVSLLFQTFKQILVE